MAELLSLADDVLIQPCGVDGAPDACHVIVADRETGLSAAGLALRVEDVGRAHLQARVRLLEHVRLAKGGG